MGIVHKSKSWNGQLPVEEICRSSALKVGKTFLWDMVDPYRRPKTFKPLVTIYILAFYSGVIGSAVTEQLYKEKYWEEHPGQAVPLMRPKFYYGPWKILKGDVPTPNT